MPCPFGFTAEDDEDGDVSGSESENDKPAKEEPEEKKGDGGAEEEATPAPGTDAKPLKSKKAKAKAGPLEFDFEKDPVSWFYQNQIKSEAEFVKKKEALRLEARKRLDQIMSKKEKRVEWPSDSDLDELSIRSSELSDLDSDVNSLGSIISCANSWIEDARYGTPAEKALGWTSYAALAAAAYSLYLTMHAVNTTRKVQGVLSDSYWPAAAFASAGLLGASFIGALLAVRYRSKRLLLVSQAAMLLLYSAFLVILCGVALRPTGVDPKLREVACVKYGKSDQGSRLCKMLPGIERDLAEQMTGMAWAGGAAACASLACLVCSVWYLYELSYIERKAIKHKRRHKRRKHSIPWDKIKIVGPVSNCGAGGPGAKGKAGGGKCPMSFGGGGEAGGGGGKCPMSFGGGGEVVAKAGGEKKND